MYTDSFFLWAADEAVRIQLSRNILDGSGASIYYYYFAYRGHRSFSELFGDPTRDFGELEGKFILQTHTVLSYNSWNYIIHILLFLVGKLKNKYANISCTPFISMKGFINRECNIKSLKDVTPCLTYKGRQM
jgi:hypothetical protein